MKTNKCMPKTASCIHSQMKRKSKAAFCTGRIDHFFPQNIIVFKMSFGTLELSSRSYKNTLKSLSGDQCSRIVFRNLLSKECT